MSAIPARYQALVLNGAGYDTLEEQSRAFPELTNTDVLVQIHAVSVNHRDLKIVKGTYPYGCNFPVVPFSDAAGTVVSTGPDATRWKVGDRVAPIFMPGWRSGDYDITASYNERMLGGGIDGVAQQYIVCDEQDLVAVPDSLSFEEAAAVPTAGATAWHALIHMNMLKPGDTILTMGSGGVAIFALQIALMHGARVIAMSSDNQKLDRLKQLGATHAINYREHPGWDEKVRDLTNGRGVDTVIDIAGQETFQRSLGATRDGGNVAIVGHITGAMEYPLVIDERGIHAAHIPAYSGEMLDNLYHALDANGVQPVIGSAFPISDIRKAFDQLESGTHFGKIVLSL